VYSNFDSSTEVHVNCTTTNVTNGVAVLFQTTFSFKKMPFKKKIV
jgi:hypothetical protein